MAVIKKMKQLDKLDLSATYLLLISPENIPHLAIVSEGKYYSLTHKKSFIAEPFGPYFNFLKRANRKMIFIEFSDPIVNPEEIFGRYQKADMDSTTCLLPVKDCLLPGSAAGFVYELVPELYAANKIKQAFHVNMEYDLTDLGDFNLSIYPKEAIFSYIESLNEKYVKRQ